MSVPQLPAKFESRAIVNPEDFIAYHEAAGRHRVDAAPRVAIFLYHRGLAERILETHPAQTIEGFFGDVMPLDETGGTVALVANFGIGAPVAAILMEDLIAAGCRTFLTVGTTGALQPGAAIGDVIVCEQSIRDDGTSHHYLPADRPAVATPELTDEVCTALDDAGVSFTRGLSWTTDAPYRETEAEIRHYQQQGVLSVEMEAAALFAVAEHRGVDIATLLTVSDLLADLEWSPAFHADETGDALTQLFDVALSVARARAVTTT